ncbi:MAG: hemolysin family protein, partial [Bacteroidota bacterium]
MDILVVYILLTLLFSAFFSGIEIAYVSADKLQIELKGQTGSYSSRLLSKLVRKPPSYFIGATLTGNTIALVLYGIFMANLLEPKISDLWFGIFGNDAPDIAVMIIQTIVSTLIVLVTAEFLPKSLFLINPNSLLTILAIPAWIAYWVLLVPVFLVVNLSKLIIVKILRLEYSESKPVFGLTDLNNYIQRLSEAAAEDNKVEVDAKIFTNALEFKTVRVRECMIPRTEITSIDVEGGIEELKKSFVDSGHSKILVYKDSIDDVIGYTHSSELFKKPKSITHILTPIIIVPETMLANELMIQFITEHKSLALVVDEFGGTSGIVTMEDIIEEIFGEIQDEHDEEDLPEQKVDEHTYILSARHEIDYLNDKYGWQLPEGEYETLGGLILSITEDL